MVQANEVALSNGRAGVVYAQSVEMRDAQAGLVLARQVQGSPIQTKILLAGQVDGPVETVVDTQQVAVIGLLTGVVMGLVLFALNWLIGRKR
jgi:hypothetical protein